MKVLHMEINKCAECPYLEGTILEPTHWCGKTDEVITLKGVFVIPSFCPLPNKKGDEDER